jgi:hypothetical protein
MAVTGSTYKNLTASGVIYAAPTKLCSVVLTAAAADVTAIVYDNASTTGTIICKLAAIVGTTASISFGSYPVTCAAGVYIALTGTGVSCSATTY